MTKSKKQHGCKSDSFREKCVIRATKHGLSETAAYNSWVAIKQRTTNSNYPRYEDYGGRGIKMLDAWHDSFEEFFKAVGPAPFLGASVDRIDNSKGYFPGNVRWASAKQQGNNRRNNVILEHGGMKKTISQWADATGIPHYVIRSRLKYGWSNADALTLPVSREKYKFRRSEP